MKFIFIIYMFAIVMAAREAQPPAQGQGSAAAGLLAAGGLQRDVKKTMQLVGGLRDGHGDFHSYFLKSSVGHLPIPEFIGPDTGRVTREHKTNKKIREKEIPMLNFNVIDGDALLVARPSGIVNAEVAEGIVEFVEIKEEQLEMGFNRFCDLTGLEGIDLRSEDVRHLADRRSAFNPNQVHVKSAFLATDPLTFGIARMYEQLLNSPRIAVRVWSDIQAAADWLGVKPAKLTL
jgi:hypothetical protein